MIFKTGKRLLVFYLASHGFDLASKRKVFDDHDLVFNLTLDKINKKRKIFYFLVADYVLSVEVVI